MAKDKTGETVGFGDYVAVLETADNEATIMRIVKFSETPKGVVAVGAYVELHGNGRVAKRKVDVSQAKLVMRNGSAVFNEVAP